MELSRHLTALLIPLNLSLSLLAVAALLVLLRRYRFAVSLAMLAGSWVLFWSLPASSLYLGGRLEQRFPYQPPEALPQAQAIVVLGGNIANNRHNWFEDLDRKLATARVDMAASLYRAGRAPRILLSGAALDGQLSEAEMMASILKQKGIEEEALILETHSLTTHQNAVYTRRALENLGIRQFLLTTSALHMPRAMAVFQKLGLDPVAAALPPQITRPGKPGFSAWRPSLRSLSASRSIIKEYAGLLIYRLRGWI